jgi:hypothetical protein
MYISILKDHRKIPFTEHFQSETISTAVYNKQLFQHIFDLKADTDNIDRSFLRKMSAYVRTVLNSKTSNGYRSMLVEGHVKELIR